MGIPVFAPRFDTDLLKPFFAALSRGELQLSACSQCGQIYWYPPEVMPCHPDAPLLWKTVAPTGTVYSFTTVERSLLPGDHRNEVPFTVVLVESDDAPGARVPGLLLGDANPRCGMRVRLRPVPVGDHTLPGFESFTE